MLIVPFVLEITFEGNYGGHPWANVQHLVWDQDTPDRSAADLSIIAFNVATAYETGIQTAQNVNVALTNIKCADLDSATGQIVNVSSPSVGDRSNTGLPANVSVLAQKVDAHDRSQRPGRMYFVGPCETDTSADDPSSLDATALSLWQGAASDYLTGCSGSQGGAAYYPAVLHKSSAPSGFTAYAQTDLVVASGLATQRRRLRH